MSVKIKKNRIIMTRGDSLRVTISLTDENGVPYEPVEGDSIRFAAKQTFADEEPTILVDIPIDTMELYLAPDETKKFPQPGEYVYDIQIIFANGDVNTFISNRLELIEEVE